MNNKGYERAYHREYDTTYMSEEILRNKELFEKLDQDLAKRRKEKTTWDSIDKVRDAIEEYMGFNAKDILQNTKIEFDKIFFLRNVFYSVSRDNSFIVFPSLSAREEYKLEVIKLYGCVISGDQYFSNQYNELLGLMYQYLYLMETDKDARKTFEDLNMAGKLRKACKLFAAKEKYNGKEDHISVYDYCRKLFSIVQSYSSFDAALQLIDKMSLDKEGVLQFIKEMGENPECIEDMVRDIGINTYNYHSFRKTIDKRKNNRG